MSLLLRLKSIIGAKDRWQNFTESGKFGKIPVKIIKINLNVWVGLISNFAQIIKFVFKSMKCNSIVRILENLKDSDSQNMNTKDILKI